MTEKELRIQSLETMLAWEKAPDEDKPEVEFFYNDVLKNLRDYNGIWSLWHCLHWDIAKQYYRIKKPKNKWLETGIVEDKTKIKCRYLIMGYHQDPNEYFLIQSWYPEEEMDELFTPVKSLGED